MVEGIILWLIIGAVAGWLAGKIVEGAGFGLIVDIIVGVVGAFIGGWLAGDPKPWQPEAVTAVSDRLVFKPRLAPVA